jgi:DNA polymerase III epsilon subunit-like protein
MTTTVPRFILFFDTETTGLIPNGALSIDQFPYIIQLSYILYDTETYTTVETFNQYVRVAPTVVISEIVTTITGITREMCDDGLPIEDCLRAFRNAYLKADLLVAHNLKFDIEMIRCEIKRYIQPLFMSSSSSSYDIDDVTAFMNMFKLNKPTYCTMLKSTDLCDIRKTPESKYKKYPKLSELFQKLYSDETLPTNLHNSMTDVLVCLRCYMQMTGIKEITRTEFNDMLNYA